MEKTCDIISGGKVAKKKIVSAKFQTEALHNSFQSASKVSPDITTSLLPSSEEPSV